MFPILFCIHFFDKENLYSSQKLLSLVIISFIIVTFMYDSGVIFFLGEIRCLSLLGVKGFLCFSRIVVFLSSFPKDLNL